MAEREDVVDRGFLVVETVIYLAIAVVLCGGAAVLLVDAGYQLVHGLSDSVRTAAAESLNAMLLAFIFVELLSAVRTTIRRRGLVAEPFLLVGIIASIKEIIVTAGTEQLEGDALRDAMTEIAVLGGLVLVLAAAAYLLRLKEAQPEESKA